MRRSATQVEASLPWLDESVDRLDVEVRAHIGHYWQGRANAELQVADAFSQLTRILDGSSAVNVVQMLGQSVENERHHANLCWRLAKRYLGRDLSQPAVTCARLPALAQVDPGARATVHLAGLCCINESIANVWLEQCVSRTTAPLARAVSQLHLSDEVLHARVGWAHLASRFVTPSIRAELERWLVPLVRANVGRWLGAEVTGQAVGVPAHALPSVEDHRAAVLGAVRNVVLPGFQHCGVDVGRVQSWFDTAFPPQA